MFVCCLNIFLKISAYFFPPLARRTGPAKAIVNNSGISQIKIKMERVMNIKCVKYF